MGSKLSTPRLQIATWYVHYSPKGCRLIASCRRSLLSSGSALPYTYFTLKPSWTAEAELVGTEELLVFGGRATKGSVCVAFGLPTVVELAVTGIVPSAMLKWLIVRLKSCRAAMAVSG